MSHTYLSDIPPFALYQNLYFIGSSRVSVHLIDTAEGLVMIDTGFPDMTEQILDSMEALGFDPKDIRAIFHSHGHYDHFGCTVRFKELSGATTYISRIDNELVNGKIPMTLERYPLPRFDCDVLVEDGDVFSFGDVTVRCLLTPGHTDGVLSFLITLKNGEETVVAAMHGGIGRNTLRAEFLNKHGLSFACRELFRAGLHRLAVERVDLVLGNHPQQSDTAGKRERVLRGESVLDTTEWQRFLLHTEQKLDEMLREEAEG